MGSVSSDHHVVLFPYMSKGHLIPILNLAQLLLRRPRIAVTVFTTPSNRPFISDFLSTTTITEPTRCSIIDIPYPENVPEIPAGIESTDKLPSMSLYVPFTRATKLMQPHFERALESLPRVSFMVSDGFLWWTLDSSTKFGFPRIVFYGMNYYSSVVCTSVGQNQLLSGLESDHELVALPEFPWIKVSKKDFDPPFTDPEPKSSPLSDLFTDQIIATSNSYGMIFNSFYELEPVFVDHWNREGKSKSWCVGPLCLAEELQPKRNDDSEYWMTWLDEKLEEEGGRSSVMYVAFGSQAEISGQQLKEIATGLEKSGVNFLWVIRKKADSEQLGEGFEERVKGRGVVVREWVDQKRILWHESVGGFLSHCGWNSALESICAGVPILAWPISAEQPLNARMVTEEIKAGIRVETSDGSVRGFVTWQGLEKTVRELMEGEKGEEVRCKVKELSVSAKKAMEEDNGSSWRGLDSLISCMSNHD